MQARKRLAAYAPVTPLLASDPAAIGAVHLENVEAGATIVLAATFRALPSVTPQWADAIAVAVAIAAAAAGDRAEVAASFGPLFDHAWAAADEPARRAALVGLSDAVAAATRAGAARVVLETLVDRDEGLRMIRAARSATAAPLVASWVPSPRGLVADVDVQAIVDAARDAGADDVGLNCGDPAILAAAFARATPGAITWCKPARGDADDRTVLAHLAALAEVAVVGGCCGVHADVLARLPHVSTASTGDGAAPPRGTFRPPDPA